jgi:hypothetical protein
MLKPIIPPLKLGDQNEAVANLAGCLVDRMRVFFYFFYFIK